MKLVLLLLLFTSSACLAQPVSDTIRVDCGNAPIYFERQCYDTVQSIAFVHVHENETTALQAARWLVDSIQQNFLATWHCQQQRFVDFSVGSNSYRFDPNRIYSTAGIRQTLGSKVADTAATLVQAVADSFLQHYILHKKLVVAVHNNTNAGGLSVKSYSTGNIYSKDAKAVYINPRRDADDFFYTTEEKYFRYFKKKGYNVVFQNNIQVTDDGSLSVFCARENISYINVEAQNEHLQQQKEMLAEIWKMIENEL